MEATHEMIDTGWCNEHESVAFQGTLAECKAYLAAHGQQADFVRAIPGAKKAAAKSAARAALFASFGLPAVSTTQVRVSDINDRTGWTK